MTEISTKITRFGYIVDKTTLPEDELAKLKQDLKVKPYSPMSFGFTPKDNSFPIYIENGDYIGIPKYFGIERFGQPKINKLETYDYPKFDMQYLGKLRPKQEEIVAKVKAGFKKDRGGVIVCGCGSGKTNMAIWIACKYKLKTLFIVHKEFLMNQVINRIKSTTNCQKVGIIQQKKTEIEHEFVVGMVQSLSKIDYDDKIFKDFGLIIIDEVHHMGARNFSKVYQKMSAKYMLGISAERERNDGTYNLIHWYMGPLLHAEEQKPNDMVVVKKYHFNTSNTKRMETHYIKGTEEPDRSTMITNLVCIKRRNRFILNVILELYDQGKNILFLTGRLKQIDVLLEKLNENESTKGNVGTYIGSMKQSELDKSATKQIILGTYDMASEGLDLENLNAVILATPKSSVKQSIGRILRKDVYEEHPIVIDIVDDCNQVFRNQSRKRDKYYHQQEYNIQRFNVADYKPGEGHDDKDGKSKKSAKPKKEFEQWNDTEFIEKSLKEKPLIDPKAKKKLAFAAKKTFKPINFAALKFAD